ncbi:thioredoxin family protein [Shinella sp. CPCC 101442]|nr:thioredoxin family protein [Shinella sp. CPCC 101442]MCR6501648.1 thioredoxin family protein [Shinella sp. CPCC 101442]
MLGASTASAEEAIKPKGVVELFTSQGCSSCPPADKALETLAREGEVVALSYHVDYWNYLGWADTLASKDNTDRQYAYARMFGRNGVYTPQAVLNGREHINGADISGIRARIGAMPDEGKGLTVPVDVEVKNDELRIRVGPGEGKANIVIAYFERERTINIDKGENVGKTVNYWHAVTDMETIGMWEGKETNLVLPADMLKKKKKSGGCAILLQRMKTADTPGDILGAMVLTGDKATR